MRDEYGKVASQDRETWIRTKHTTGTDILEDAGGDSFALPVAMAFFTSAMSSSSVGPRLDGLSDVDDIVRTGRLGCCANSGVNEVGQY